MSDPGTPEEHAMEIMPTNNELVDRIDRVTDAINNLRNKVQGRGVAPVGPPALAAKVNEAQLSWDAVRAELLQSLHNAGAMLTPGGIIGPSNWDASDRIETWETKVNTLLDEAGAAGLLGDAWLKIPVTHAVHSASEAMDVAEKRIVDAASTLFGGIGTGLLVIAGGIVIVLGIKLWSK